MIRTSFVGVVVLVATLASGLPEPDHPPPSYGAPPVAPSYGPPPQACYPKVVTHTMTKDVQATSVNYGTKYKKNPSTIYASIIETVVAPKTVVLYSTMTAYSEPKIKTQQKLLYDTKMVTKHNYHTETKYGYHTAQQYFTETEGVYVTKTVTQSYPLTNSVTNVNIKTNNYYVTQTKVQPQYKTITINEPYYVTKYEKITKQQYVQHTNTQTQHQYHTNTEWVTVPEYHTVTDCPKPTYHEPGYSQGGYAPPAAATAYPAAPSGYPPARKPTGYGY